MSNSLNRGRPTLASTLKVVVYVAWGSEPVNQRLQRFCVLSDCAVCYSERTMDLVLEMCNTRSVHWCGVSGRQLGKVGPSAFLSLPLKLLSSVQGLQVRLRPVAVFRALKRPRAGATFNMDGFGSSPMPDYCLSFLCFLFRVSLDCGSLIPF